MEEYKLGTVEASEQLISELYIDLRRKVNRWADITKQTAQARMGYVGQHLVSIATGFEGSRTGARGKDLILPDDDHAEIKTCYRVDQLGRCNNCKSVIASTEEKCPVCGVEDVKRNDDSKWLISIRNDEELERILDPKHYFLVLFEFVDLYSPTTIQASIWQVDPTSPGFAYCMVDYYKNIRAKSRSSAPFNLWPYQLKFDIMKPILIYRSLIYEDDSIETILFPHRDERKVHPPKPLQEYSRSSNLTKGKIVELGRHFDIEVDPSASKRDLLESIQGFIDRDRMKPGTVADGLARVLYLPAIEAHVPALPQEFADRLGLD